MPEQTVLRLEQLRQQTGKQSIAEVVVEAAELYAQLRTSGESTSNQLTPRSREVLRLGQTASRQKGSPRDSRSA